jgi:hypothetical protein
MVKYLTTAQQMKEYHRMEVARKIALKDMKKLNKRKKKTS